MSRLETELEGIVLVVKAHLLRCNNKIKSYVKICIFYIVGLNFIQDALVVFSKSFLKELLIK